MTKISLFPSTNASEMSEGNQLCFMTNPKHSREICYLTKICLFSFNKRDEWRTQVLLKSCHKRHPDWYFTTKCHFSFALPSNQLQLELCCPNLCAICLITWQKPRIGYFCCQRHIYLAIWVLISWRKKFENRANAYFGIPEKVQRGVNNVIAHF